MRPFIAAGARVLDVGCGDAALSRLVPGIGEYVGIDPAAEDEVRGPSFRLVRGALPHPCPPLEPFDAIVMLATVEHVPAEALPELARACAGLLRERGKVLATVPDARVDAILEVLAGLRLIDASDMKVHEHHGFEAGRTVALFEESGFRLARRAPFQFGLNNLFVFEKVSRL